LWNGREVKPSQGYADTLFVDHAIDFINRHRNEPFFCYVPVTCPHGLIQAPADEIEAFKGKFKETNPDKPLNATYAAMVTRMDKDIGRILKKLDDLDLAHDTIVIFVSDHGASYEKMTQGTTTYFDSNRPFRGQKRTLWEGGLRVPAVVRWPGRIPAKVDTHEIIHMCDLFPTIVTAAGGTVDPKWHVDGQDMMDVWRGKAKAPDRMLFWNWDEGGNTQFAAMHGDLKIVVSGGNQPELFDVEADPAERRQANALHPDEVKKLKDGLDAWLATESDAAKQRRKASTSQSAQD
jgi:arylsulfatase A-like enzyme